MSVKVQCHEVGLLGTNCYLITDEATGKSAIVDPGGVTDDLDKSIQEIGANSFEYILLTHGHFDHIGGVNYYKGLLKPQIAIHEKDAVFTENGEVNLGLMYMRTPMPPFKADLLLNDGDVLVLGETRIKLLHTPGHTCGSSCYVVDDILFSGDTLMRLSIGRTDFPTGNYDEIKDSLKKLAALHGDFRVFPGHGEATTLEFERENNPYLGMVEYDDIY